MHNNTLTIVPPVTKVLNTLRSENLVKFYRKRKIVDNVTLKVTQSSIVGLLGPNGAGKTSCFYMMLGLIKSDAGRIYLNNLDLTYLPINQRAKLGVGYLPQESSIFRKLSVADNILAVLEVIEGGTNREIITQRLESLLNEFNLSHLRHTLGINLSGGERRRLEIARTLAINPKFILLDEPFAGVDPISIFDIKRIFQKLVQRNIGILISDHNVRETLNICDNAYVMDNGKIIAEGTMHDIINNNLVKEVYLGKEFIV